MSVQSPSEAEAAIRGGADILDVKDPARGSLGCAGPEVMATIPALNRPLTAALGECVDWADARPFRVPSTVSMIKLGLAGLGRRETWVGEWLDVRRRFEDEFGAGLAWVAVAYVDKRAAASPEIGEVASATIETGCVGLLLDTFDKRGGGLFEYVSEGVLIDLAAQMHAADRFLAVAGRLNLGDVSRLGGLPVDVVAVRSAACSGEDRRSSIRSDQVAACRAALHRTAPQLSGAC